MSRTPGRPDRPAPAFGEHTDDALREAGYSDAEIEEMKESGAAAGTTAGATGSFLA
jgi:crotonobetainyl-CoA:carnitine CoA-transferase CaiB-like acyl-CoA transferase